MGGSNSLEGRVELCYDGVWGTVCDELWGSEEVAVTCRQLGYSGSGIKMIDIFNQKPHCYCILYAGGRSATFGQGNGPILLTNVTCNGLEGALLECSNTRLHSQVPNCSHRQDAGVVCIASILLLTLDLSKATWIHSVGCNEGEVRLVGGTSRREGRVEICFSNEWGTVCDRMWDTTDARVVCRQLGYVYIGKCLEIVIAGMIYFCVCIGVEAFGQANFGEGTGRIWLGDVQCTGDETTLRNCRSSSGASLCSHNQDAGVRCPLGKHTISA